MDITLNVGLKKSERFEYEAKTNLTVSEVVDTLLAYGFHVQASRVAQSNTEPTLVILASFRRKSGWFPALHSVSCLLRQDCIAAKIGDKGYLVGPFHHHWGEFNPEYFIDF